MGVILTQGQRPGVALLLLWDCLGTLLSSGLEIPLVIPRAQGGLCVLSCPPKKSPATLPGMCWSCCWCQGGAGGQLWNWKIFLYSKDRRDKSSSSQLGGVAVFVAIHLTVPLWLSRAPAMPCRGGRALTLPAPRVSIPFCLISSAPFPGSSHSGFFFSPPTSHLGGAFWSRSRCIIGRLLLLRRPHMLSIKNCLFL